MSARILPRAPVSPDLIGPWDDVLTALDDPTALRRLMPKVRIAKQQAVMLNQRIDEIQRVLNEMIEVSGGNVLTLSDSGPAAVGATASPGASDEASRADHVHQGVTSIRNVAAVSGLIRLYGYVTQVGNTFTVGGSGAPPSLVCNETPTGLINSANTSYVLAYEAVDIDHIFFFYNGQLLFPDGGSLTSGQRLVSWTAATKTIVVGKAPTTGSTIRVWYYKV